MARCGTDGRSRDRFVLGKTHGEYAHAASLAAPFSGLALDVCTMQPGMQVYTGDKLDAPFAPRRAICLEARNFPDAPNHPGFPSPLLRAGEEYRQRNTYDFRQGAGSGRMNLPTSRRPGAHDRKHSR